MVSDLGRVMRLAGYRCRANRVLRPGLTTGYLFVALCADGIPVLHMNHRLVCAAFIGPCPGGKEVNHKNGVRGDSRLANLEYVTHRENIQHGHDTLPRKHTSLRGSMLPNAVLNEDKVRDIRARRERGQSYRVIAKALAVSTHLVYMVLKRKSWAWVT